MASAGIRSRIKEQRKRFKTYESAGLTSTTALGDADRVSTFTCVELHDSAGKMEGSAFHRNVVKVTPN